MLFRSVSTTPLQALLLLNGKLVNEEAVHFAERVFKSAGSDPAAQVQEAWHCALTRAPTTAELRDALDFLAASLPGESLAGLCRVVYNLNEFVYVD